MSLQVQNISINPTSLTVAMSNPNTSGLLSSTYKSTLVATVPVGTPINTYYVPLLTETGQHAYFNGGVSNYLVKNTVPIGATLSSLSLWISSVSATTLSTVSPLLGYAVTNPSFTQPLVNGLVNAQGSVGNAQFSVGNTSLVGYLYLSLVLTTVTTTATGQFKVTVVSN